MDIEILHNATRVGRNPMLTAVNLHAYMLTRLHACMFLCLHATLRNRSCSAIFASRRAPQAADKTVGNRSRFAMPRAKKLYAYIPFCLHIYVFTCWLLIR